MAICILIESFLTRNAKFSCRWQSDSLRSQFTNQFLFGSLVSASYLLLTLWKIRSEDTSFKCLHKEMLYSFIQFFGKRKFRSQACLLFWTCCLFKEPIHNFLLFLLFLVAEWLPFRTFLCILSMLHEY